MDISWYVYEPLDYEKSWGVRVDKTLCRYSVHNEGRSVSFHQCRRKPTEKVEGFGFCRQHAKMVKEGLRS